VIVFNPLEREDIHQIIDIELAKLFARIKDIGYDLNLTDAAKDYIAEKGFDSIFMDLDKKKEELTIKIKKAKKSSEA